MDDDGELSDVGLEDQLRRCEASEETMGLSLVLSEPSVEATLADSCPCAVGFAHMCSSPFISESDTLAAAPVKDVQWKLLYL